MQPTENADQYPTDSQEDKVETFNLFDRRVHVEKYARFQR